MRLIKILQEIQTQTITPKMVENMVNDIIENTPPNLGKIEEIEEIFMKYIPEEWHDLSLEYEEMFQKISPNQLTQIYKELTQIKTKYNGR